MNTKFIVTILLLTHTFIYGCKNTKIRDNNNNRINEYYYQMSNKYYYQDELDCFNSLPQTTNYNIGDRIVGVQYINQVEGIAYKYGYIKEIKKYDIYETKEGFLLMGDKKVCPYHVIFNDSTDVWTNDVQIRKLINVTDIVGHQIQENRDSWTQRGTGTGVEGTLK